MGRLKFLLFGLLVCQEAAPLVENSTQSRLYTNQIQTYGCNVNDFYEFEWELVYALDRSMPQGCTCAKSSSSDSECNVFDCECTCDMSAGACDPNCCCDPDCLEVEVSRFEDSDIGCLLGERDPGFQQCYNAEGVNERYSTEVTGTSRQALDELLCVQADNTDIKGEYLADPGNFEGESSIFDEARGQKSFSYPNYVPGDSKERGSTTVYYRGDAMRVATGSFGGFLPMPTAGFDGQCLDTNYGHFLEPVRGNRCARVVQSDLGRWCGSTLDARRFANLMVCSEYKTTRGGCTKWVPVQLGRVSFRDPSTLEETPLRNSTGGAVLPSADFTPGSGCAFAAVSICYYIYHTPEGAIDKVFLDATLTNMSAFSAGLVHQSFSLEFLSTQRAGEVSAKTAAASGNAVLRGRSGNPGYVAGRPLLNARAADRPGGGQAKEAKEAMKARVPGLLVYGASPLCDDRMPLQVVNFGEDSISGCVLRLTYDNFTQMCSQTGPLVRSTGSSSGEVRVPKYLWVDEASAYIGKFGNADPLDASQWLKMTLEEQPDTPTLEPGLRSCKYLTTSLHFQFLVGHVGDVGNPQAKVIGARAYYGSEEVVFSSESGVQGIALTTTVSFVTIEEKEYAPYAPPPPPVLWSVPYDVFYPFDVSSARGRTSTMPLSLSVGAFSLFMAYFSTHQTSALAV